MLSQRHEVVLTSNRRARGPVTPPPSAVPRCATQSKSALVRRSAAAKSDGSRSASSGQRSALSSPTSHAPASRARSRRSKSRCSRRQATASAISSPRAPGVPQIVMTAIHHSTWSFGVGRWSASRWQANFSYPPDVPSGGVLVLPARWRGEVTTTIRPRRRPVWTGAHSLTGESVVGWIDRGDSVIDASSIMGGDTSVPCPSFTRSDECRPLRQ